MRIITKAFIIEMEPCRILCSAIANPDLTATLVLQWRIEGLLISVSHTYTQFTAWNATWKRLAFASVETSGTLPQVGRIGDVLPLFQGMNSVLAFSTCRRTVDIVFSSMLRGNNVLMWAMVASSPFFLNLRYVIVLANYLSRMIGKSKVVNT